MPCWPAARSGAIPRPVSARSSRTHPRPTRSALPKARRPEEDPMATTAPEHTTPDAAGWLAPFLADWRPGPGAPKEIREPASGRPLLTLPQSTPDDVARAAAAAAAAQPAWADTSYAERAAILRRAADIYEAHRPEFGTWTQRETGAGHSKMFHEANFAAGERHAAAPPPS